MCIHSKGRLLYSLLALLTCILAGCMGQKTATPIRHEPSPPARVSSPPAQSPIQFGTGQLSPAIDTVARQVLTNISQHGWNPRATTHGQVTGGLYINWKMDDPGHTNALKAGSDDVTAGNHDPQVDLLYLNALAEYNTLHPTDQNYSSEVHKATNQVRLDFRNYNVPKGWLYFTLLRDGILLKDTELIDEAHTLASNFYAHWYDPNIGIVFNRAHLPGNVNVEHALNCGTALIDAGTRWNQPTWIQAGTSTIDHILAAGLNPQYHLLYQSIAVTADEQLQIQNYQAKPSTQGNGAEALLNAYVITHQQRYLDTAGQLLQSMFSSPLWDSAHEGLLFALDMDTNTLEQSYKETRSQTLSLIALTHYNRLLQHMGRQPLMRDKEQGLIDVLVNHLYQPTYHGYFYRMTPDYHIYVSRPGTGIGVESYFTTEAMGTALDALQQTEFANITF